MRMQPDGSRFLALTDRGHWLRGRLVYAGSAPAGIADAEMAAMLGPDGKRLAQRGWWDTESIAEDSGTIYVGIERVHRIVKYDFAKDGFRARGVPIPVPAEFKTFPFNESIDRKSVV